MRCRPAQIWTGRDPETFGNMVKLRGRASGNFRPPAGGVSRTGKATAFAAGDSKQSEVAKRGDGAGGGAVHQESVVGAGVRRKSAAAGNRTQAAAILDQHQRKQLPFSPSCPADPWTCCRVRSIRRSSTARCQVGPSVGPLKSRRWGAGIASPWTPSRSASSLVALAGRGSARSENVRAASRRACRYRPLPSK